jgi:hypothetical protein
MFGRSVVRSVLTQLLEQNGYGIPTKLEANLEADLEDQRDSQPTCQLDGAA